MNPHAATVEDYDEEESRRASPAPSSPPTSIDTGNKTNSAFANPISSNRASFSDIDARENDATQQYRMPSLTTSQFSAMPSEGDEDEDDFRYGQQRDTPIDDPDSQWESDAAPPSPKLQRTTSNVSASQLRSKKSSISSAGKLIARPSRPSASSTKLHLQPQRSSTTHFYSRASSASYNEASRDGKKAPLVLLHITLLFLPGAEEAILTKITPTMLERGLLVEHPRGDYQLLEELVIDSLGLDDLTVPGQEEEEQDEWEKSLGVRRVKAKSQWELRVYAANGLMTSGAWKRVWGEMERVDVEVGPKNWRSKKVGSTLWTKLFLSPEANSAAKTNELIRGFTRSHGRAGSKDSGAISARRRSNVAMFAAPPGNSLKWWLGVGAGLVVLLAACFGLFSTLGGKQLWSARTEESTLSPVSYSLGGGGVPQIVVNNDDYEIAKGSGSGVDVVEPVRAAGVDVVEPVKAAGIVEPVVEVRSICEEEPAATIEVEPLVVEETAIPEIPNCIRLEDQVVDEPAVVDKVPVDSDATEAVAADVLPMDTINTNTEATGEETQPSTEVPEEDESDEKRGGFLGMW